MTRIGQINTDYFTFAYYPVMLHYEEKTGLIIKCFYKVYNALGYGFLEQVYENALCVELTGAGFYCEKQKPITVIYQGINVGHYYADVMVDGVIILELKATESLRQEHEFQLINYLKATDVKVGLLLNFGKRPEFRRKVFTNNK